VRGLLERLRRGDVPELGQIEDLHPVRPRAVGHFGLINSKLSKD
jgi:hypothetical protein